MDNDETGPARPLRQGEAWSKREYEQLVHAVAAGESVVRIAKQRRIRKVGLNDCG